MSNIDQFIAGQPAAYCGFTGQSLTARYQNGERNGLGVGSLEIKDARGKAIRNVIMGEHQARSFFLNIDRVAA